MSKQYSSKKIKQSACAKNRVLETLHSEVINA